MTGTIHQINTKKQTLGERGIPKKPVTSAHITYQGVSGDYNRHRHEKKNDDLDNALLLIPLEMIQTLNDEGWQIQPGDLGENITTQGLPYNTFSPGKEYQLGAHIRIQITKPCTPCKNLYLLVSNDQEKGPAFLKTLVGRRGWYAKVLTEGTITTGDTIEEIIK